MPIIDEHTREWLTLEVGRPITSTDIIDVLGRLIAERGAPAFIPMITDWSSWLRPFEDTSTI